MRGRRLLSSATNARITEYFYIGFALFFCWRSISLLGYEEDSFCEPIFSVRDLVIVRPFSPHNTEEMVKSFGAWSDNIPCSKPRNVDLILFNSGNLYNASRVNRLVSPLLSAFQTKKSIWHKCFRSMSLKSANIPLLADIYNKSRAKNDLDWVLGPNTQFQILLQTLMGGTFGQSFETMFLMESDMIPSVNFWLDLLLDEIENKTPFMVLGSQYLGSCWFYSGADSGTALFSHTNGNAVYNLSHPILQELHDKLAQELGSIMRQTPFDVRMEELDYNKPGHRERFKRSQLIGNFVGTIELASSPFGHALTHGAVSRYPLPRNETIDLIVTNYHGEKGVLRLRHELEGVVHPFKRVYVYSENVLGSTEVLTSGTELITLQRTNFSSLFDWVFAPATSTWVAYTHTFFSLLNTRFTGDIIDGKFRPTIPYEACPTRMKKIWKPVACISDDAKLFNPGYAKVIPTTSAVFKVDLRQQFFHDWLGTTATRGKERYPSSNDYFSWCEEKNITIYDFAPVATLCPLYNVALNVDFDKIPLPKVVDDVPGTYRKYEGKIVRFECYAKFLKEDCLNSCCHWYHTFKRCSANAGPNSERRC